MRGIPAAGAAGKGAQSRFPRKKMLRQGKKVPFRPQIPAAGRFFSVRRQNKPAKLSCFLVLRQAKNELVTILVIILVTLFIPRPPLCYKTTGFRHKKMRPGPRRHLQREACNQR